MKEDNLEDENIYCLAFSCSNIGPKGFQLLLNKFGDSKNAWNGTKGEYYELGIKDKSFETFEKFRNKFDINSYYEKLKKEQVQFVSYLDKRYPSGLKKLENPPIGIFVKGNAKLLKEKLSIGVVGTRKITSYGKNVTESIVSELVNSDVSIVSGLALGVDGTAHRTAVLKNGKTIAVLACGVDCCSPSENFSLYSDILTNDGLIISEYPLSCPPNKGTFLARNRIIAALSNGVLVTEAAEGSGSLVTADWGLRLSKKVFAVPGPITSRMSDGSLKLLKQGAKLVTEGKDVLEEFKAHNSKLRTATQKLKNINLSKEEKKIISILENESLAFDELAKESKIKPTALMVLISGLELRGIVRNNNGKLNLNG